MRPIPDQSYRGLASSGREIGERPKADMTMISYPSRCLIAAWEMSGEAGDPFFVEMISDVARQSLPCLPAQYEYRIARFRWRPPEPLLERFRKADRVGETPSIANIGD